MPLIASKIFNWNLSIVYPTLFFNFARAPMVFYGKLHQDKSLFLLQWLNNQCDFEVFPKFSISVKNSNYRYLFSKEIKTSTPPWCMEFKFLSHNIHVKDFWNIEALSIINIWEKITFTRKDYQMCFCIPYHTFSVKQVYICIIFNALSNITIKLLRKQLSMEL